MKKLIAICAVALSMGSFADSYLYWMVSDSTSWDVSPAPTYNAARIAYANGDGSSTGYLTLYSINAESIGTSIGFDAEDGTGSLYAGLVTYTEGYSYYIELLNDSTVVGKSSTLAYSEAANNILASISQTDIQSSATAWAPNFTATSAVPEPTSGMLLLFGLAGLALRRKRA